MNNINNKIKTWAELILSRKLQDVTEDIKVTITSRPDEKLNKNIFKLLLYLSHTADKCYNEKQSLGREICDLTQLLCSIVVEIPDTDKFVSCMFHIVRYLISMNLYNDAANICSHITSRNLTCNEPVMDEKLVKLSYLWRNAGTNLLNQIPTKGLEYDRYKDLKTIIQSEIGLLQIACKNSIKECIACLDQYLCKFVQVTKGSLTFVNEFHTFIFESLESQKKISVPEDKHKIYKHIKSIISKVIRSNINEKFVMLQNKQKMDNILNDMYTCLDPIVAIDEESYHCFKLFKDLSVALVRPVETFTINRVRDIKEYMDQYSMIVNKYDYSETVINTTLGIVEILEPLFVYWENYLKGGNRQLLSDGILLETMKLVECLSNVCTRQSFINCRSCGKEECQMKTDIYNSVVIKVRIITLVTKLSAEDLPKDICKLSLKFSKQIISSIHTMKLNNCICWMQLWNCCGIIIYNMGITSENFYKQSAAFYSLLFTSIVQLEGLQSKSSRLDLQNPASLALHRLCSSHYKNEQYREAMTVAALNGFLSYTDETSKAFRMWTNIKYKNYKNKEILDMSMLTCLRADEKKIKEEFNVDINSHNCDFIQLCLREARSLEEGKIDLYYAIRAVYDDLEVLQADTMQRGFVVVLMGLHLLAFDHDYRLLDYIERSITELKLLNNNTSVSCMLGNLKFFLFVERVRAISKRIVADMQASDSKFNLFATRGPYTGKSADSEEDVLPTYSMININEDSLLASSLQKAFKEWIKSFNYSKNNKEGGYWEPMLTLRTLIIAGEYSRLYRYQDCEINAWTLAYKLACAIKDDRATIYAISRIISIRRINFDWINVAKKLSETHKSTTDSDMIRTIALFWMSLADFYFECGKYIEARKLLNDARSLPGISFLDNSAVYLLSLDTIIRNWQLYHGEEAGHEKYTAIIVESLYSVINLGEQLKEKRNCWRNQEKFLFTHDVVFSFIANMSLRMNSLLSFREITAHLISRLRVAREMGITMRAAEIIKSLCYIDLSRLRLDDCEVKLQWLEHILHTETFELSMMRNKASTKQIVPALTPTKAIDPMRDVPQTDTSPILRKKAFALPDFVKHVECNCYDCRHVSYRYLVFSCTHIRAQLYALQNHAVAALQHFHGAFEIRRNIVKTEELVRTMTNHDWQNSTKQYSWQGRFYLTDYVLFLLDFSCFLRRSVTSKKQEELHLALLAVDVCKENKLDSHPISVAAQGQAFDIQFREVFNDSVSSKYTVPDIHEMDVNKQQELNESDSERNVCVTPTGPKNYAIKPRTIRRVRTPPLLKITKININYSDDEDGDSPRPKVAPKTKPRVNRQVRRKILNEEVSDVEDDTPKSELQAGSNKSTSEIIRRSISDALAKNLSVSDVIVKVASLVPDISEQLYRLAGDLHNIPATKDRMETLVGMIEDLKLISNPQRARKPKNDAQKVKRLPRREHNKNVNEAVELFKALMIKDDVVEDEEKENEFAKKESAGRKGKKSSDSSTALDEISVEQTNSCVDVNSVNSVNRSTLLPLKGNITNISDNPININKDEKVGTKSSKSSTTSKKENTSSTTRSIVRKSSRPSKEKSPPNTNTDTNAKTLKRTRDRKQEIVDISSEFSVSKLRNGSSQNSRSSENNNANTSTHRNSSDVNNETGDLITKPPLRKSKRKLATQVEKD